LKAFGGFLWFAVFGQTATETLQVILAAKVEFLFCRGLLTKLHVAPSFFIT